MKAQMTAIMKDADISATDRAMCASLYLRLCSSMLKEADAR